MGKIVKLKNANDVYTYPVTKTEAVYLEDNKTTLKDYLDAMAITKTAGPAQVVTFNDGANNVPVKSLILNIEPHQEGTGDPSPNNIRPITGYNEINITRAGKNLCPFLIAETKYGMTTTVDNNGVVTLTGTSTTVGQTIGNVSASLPAGTYIASGGSSQNYTLRVYDNDNKVTLANLGLTTAQNTFTLSATTQVRIFIRCETIAEANLTYHPMIRLASIEDNTYEPYTGYDTYEITIPSAAGAVYGGTLDVMNGELVVDKGYITVGALPWATEAAYSRFRATISDIITGLSARNTQFICSAYQSIDDGRGLSDVPDNSIYAAGASASVYIKTTAYSDATTFKSEMGDVQIVYPLMTPITYNLTPTEVATFLGYNTIWMDADGTLQVTYKADLAKYIANAISSSNS